MKKITSFFEKHKLVIKVITAILFISTFFFPFCAQSVNGIIYKEPNFSFWGTIKEFGFSYVSWWFNLFILSFFVITTFFFLISIFSFRYRFCDIIDKLNLVSSLIFMGIMLCNSIYFLLLKEYYIFTYSSYVYILISLIQIIYLIGIFQQVQPFEKKLSKSQQIAELEKTLEELQSNKNDS